MNNYHFYEEEGKGKYSVIFKARKKRKLDFVAIKRMEKSRKKKILNEANILSELNHPNIIKFYEYIESKNHMWAVTEYCPGGDLLHLIQQDKALPENVVRSFVIQILRGLQYCHSKGIVICDMKPASILINEYGNVKIGDFGSAKTLMDLTHSQNQTKKGTPSYMAPELFINGGVYSFQSDLWSVGCIMHELAQGNPPFISASYHDIATLANTAHTPKVQEFSSDFNNLLQQILQKSPENRISWDKIIAHPWIGNQLKQVEIPNEPHFQKFIAQKKKNEESNKMKFLRASQDFNKESYGKDMNSLMANDKRGEFIFQNDEGDLQDQYDQYFNPDAKMELNDKELQNAFMKKKSKNEKKGKNVKEREKDKQQLDDSTNINMFLETISRSNLVPLPDLIQHSSDNAVKPIIGNKDIEVLQSLNFNKKSLGFPYIDPETLAEGIVNGQMEDNLKQIFDGMVGDQKFNVMGYFESIIQNSDVANYLFKENFIKFYMKLMKGYKQSVLRAKIFEIMGFLVRHATVIEPDIIKYGIINAFIEGATKDKSQKVRRKAMAALGQLLFYGATQVDEGVPEWDLSLSLIHSLLKILKNSQEDEIVRIYCCKSIENITAQAKQVGLKFSQIDTMLILITCFTTTKNQGFKSSLASCFHHTITLNSSLREFFLQKIGVPNMIESVKSNEINTKTLQILLWILLIQFNKSKTSKISKMYLEDENLFRTFLSKLDHISSPIVRGRIYLYINFYLESDGKRSLYLLENTSNIVAINNNKLFSILERQNSTTGQKHNKYEIQCLQYVLVWLYENYQNLVKYTHEDIKKIYAQVEGGYKPSSKKGTGYCGIIWHMANCQSFQDLFTNQSNMEALLSILSLLDSLPPLTNTQQLTSLKSEDSPAWNLESIKGVYMQTLQKITSNNSISQKMQEYYSSKILPFIVGRILKSVHEDIKFNCMKYFLYLVSFFMNQDYLFDSTILNTTSHKITQLINSHLLPEIDSLLNKNQNQAVPTMTIKLLVVLFEINDIFVRKFHELGKIEAIVDHGYYKESANINVLKLVQKVITVEAQQGKKTEYQWILKVMAITYKILEYYVSTNQQIYLEYPIEILRQLLIINGKKWSQDFISGVWEKVLSLQGHEDMVIREKAQSLVKQILGLGKFGLSGKWDIKQKSGLENYEKYLQLSGKERDPKITQNINKITGSSRYG